MHGCINYKDFTYKDIDARLSGRKCKSSLFLAQTVFLVSSLTCLDKFCFRSHGLILFG